MKNSLRLHKYLADCGIASRRAGERLMRRGLVTVDGKVVRTPGAMVNPSTQEVRCEGRLVRPVALRYFMLHKPRDVLCTSRDPRGRRTFLDFLPADAGRLYSVGRLDRDSEGLLLVTNDGELARRLTHASFLVPKVYRVWTDAPLTAEQRDALCAGIISDGERLRAVSVSGPLEGAGARCHEVVLIEGRNRQVRRMMEALGRRVTRLQRVSVGPLRLGRLRRGTVRPLARQEIRALRKLVGLSAEAPHLSTAP